MTAPISLQVDLADPEDIRSKLPQAEQRLAGMENALAEQEREIERWRRLVGVLRSVSGTSQGGSGPVPETGPPPKPGHMQELVVATINRFGREIRSRDVRELLKQEGHDVTGDSVSNALWYAAERLGTIRRGEGRGVYAPLNDRGRTEDQTEAPTAPSETQTFALPNGNGA